MNDKTTNLWARLLAVVPLILQAACADHELDDDVIRIESAIENGTIVNPWAPGAPVESRAILSVPGCTGTLIRPSWVLTASHCGGVAPGAIVKSLRATGTPPVERTVDAAYNSPYRLDMKLAHLSQPYTDLPQISLYAGTTASLTGRTLNCYGYGAVGRCSSGTCPAGQTCGGGLCYQNTPALRRGDLVVQRNDTYPTTVYNVPRNASGQVILPGDSGGPCFSNGAQTGTHISEGADTAVPGLREWLTTPSRVVYTTGDFDGDGKADMIITSPSGSEWYYSTGVGTWANAYSRPDLPLGQVSFTPGDFDGDGKSDVIITTASGSWWYFGTATRGTFAQSTPRTETEFQLWRQQFVVGDYDGNGKDDFVLVSSIHDPMGGGSRWFYSTGRATWNQAVTRTDLYLDNVAYTPGDYDGDGQDDLVIVTPTGSFWYYSRGVGNFDAAYIREDLPLGTVAYTAADFNGDGKDDLIITVAGGAFWYYSTGVGTWSVPYVREDLTLGKVGFVPGDFSGDGKDDMIVTTSSGSLWYFSTGTGTWSQPYRQTGSVRGSVLFQVADFNGGGKADMIVTTSSSAKWYYSNGDGSWRQSFTRNDVKL